MDKALAARRLSAALGRKITEDDIEFVQSDFVCLGPGEGYMLLAGNACYVPSKIGKSGVEREPFYMKNGRPWLNVYEDESNIPRDLDLR